MRKILFAISLFFLIICSCSEKKTFTCTVCAMEFYEKKWADKCQEWCETENTCNAEITKHAIIKE